jgi:hypothetical protein
MFANIPTGHTDKSLSESTAMTFDCLLPGSDAGAGWRRIVAWINREEE